MVVLTYAPSFCSPARQQFCAALGGALAVDRATFVFRLLDADGAGALSKKTLTQAIRHNRAVRRVVARSVLAPLLERLLER